MDDRRIRRMAVAVVLTVAGLGAVPGLTGMAAATPVAQKAPVHGLPPHSPGCGVCWEQPIT